MAARVLRRTGFTAITLVLLFSGTACQRSEAPDSSANAEPSMTSAPESATSGTFDVCALFSQKEAEQVLGEPIQPPTNQLVSEGGENRAAIAECQYQSAQSPARRFSVFMRRSPVADNDPQSVRDTLSESGIQSQDVSGVGDSALWASGQLHVFAPKNIYLIVTVSGLDEPAAQEHAVSIARRVLERA